MPRTLIRVVIPLFCVIIALSAVAPSRAGGDGGPAITDASVDHAIERAVEFIKSKRGKTGHWENGESSNDLYWAGDSALALLALLYAKEDPRRDDMNNSLNWLSLQGIKSTYVYGIRAHVLALIPGSKFKTRLQGDLGWLLSAMWPRGEHDAGGYGYESADGKKGATGHYDNSNSQYGVLGIWMAADAGLKVPDDYWLTVEDHWLRDQSSDGGWPYQLKGNSTGSMTAAGLATLFVVLDQAHTRDEGRFNGTSSPNCGNYKAASRILNAIDAGMNWFGREFAPSNPKGDAGWDFYYLYGVERVGRASGRKYFRERDWFKVGAQRLLSTQKSDGSWPNAGEYMNDLRNSAYAVMFLCHGRAPLLYNKLDYGADSMNKLRDVAGLTHFAQRSFERLLNWQIVRLDGSFDDLLEAPVLYMSGHQAPNLSDVDVQKLREYCLRGGMVFGAACCSSKEFADGFRALAAKAFPEFKMQPLGEKHPLFSGEVQYSIEKPPAMAEVHNGLRSLMLLSENDVGAAWSQFLVKEYEPLFHLGCNVYLYATDKTSFTSRLQTAEITQKEVETRQTVRIARLRYEGMWDVEPYGWTRVARFLNNETGTKLLVSSGVELDSPDLDQFKLAYISGTKAFELTPAEVSGLRKFLTNGGTLLADAAGGNKEFTAALEKYVAGVLKTQPADVDADSPLFTGQGIPRAVPVQAAYRRAARKEGGGQKHPRLKVFRIGRRMAVIYSNLDVSSGLLGTPVYACRGYEPECALEMVRNLVLYAALPPSEKAQVDRGH